MLLVVLNQFLMKHAAHLFRDIRGIISERWLVVCVSLDWLVLAFFALIIFLPSLCRRVLLNERCVSLDWLAIAALCRRVLFNKRCAISLSVTMFHCSTMPVGT